MRVLMCLICIFQVAMFAPQKENILPRVGDSFRLGHVELSAGLYRFYWANNVERSWEESKKFCDDEGFKIATFKTPEQIEKLLTASSSETRFSEAYWIDASLDELPGSMKWSDGEEINSQANIEWQLEVNSGVCGAYYSESTKPYFQAILCSTQHRVICQEDLSLLPQ